jgi:uncharacterized RDD family membrane protein YckC
MICSKCGAAVAEGVAFCPACGQPVGAVGYPAATGAIPPPLPRVQYAGFWLRFVAYVIDIVVIWIVAIPIYLLLGAAFGLSMSSIARDPNGMLLGSSLGSLVLFEGCAILGLWLYFAIMESSAWQGTVGKKILGLRVTDLGGNRISFGRATGRFFGKLLSNLTFAIGYIMAGFTAKKQALHDMIAGCLVTKNVS